MLSKLIGPEDAISLLDMKGPSELDRAVAEDLIKPAREQKDGARFLVSDVIIFSLARALEHLGVDPRKAVRYAEAVLGPRLPAMNRNVLDWVENESQELFCSIADGQLARIFLRSKEDLKEVDVGAVKPVLFPTTKCEINVFRVIRPVVYRARQLLGSLKE